MNTILLEPTDVLFFRDGRPMGGASSGHGAAWPLPSVISYAFHAALHRAGELFDKAHSHRRGRNGIYQDMRDRRFGSLVTAGPFPVWSNGPENTWFFPRPADADNHGRVILRPHRHTNHSSLPRPCKYPVVSTKSPSKVTPKGWWNERVWRHYSLESQEPGAIDPSCVKSDNEFADTEHHFGIGINSATGTVSEGQFYSANYLRLREQWKLGVFAAAPDKEFQHSKLGNDLVRVLLDGQGSGIIVGGQQRHCTATIHGHGGTRLPLPLGLGHGFMASESSTGEPKYLVKWVLLTPALWPEIKAGVSASGQTIPFHPGGWLPNWVNEESGEVLLRHRPGNVRRDYSGDRPRRVAESETGISARLVAAIVPKPIPVTGWALANESDRETGGAKSTHLAVPAGAVYYFEASSAAEASKLADALNWHGSTPGTTIKNRRSTLMGEKGFGLGVCGTWNFHEAGGPA